MQPTVTSANIAQVACTVELGFFLRSKAMWPFKNKEPECDWTGEAIEKLKAFRDVGETFNYLGRTCVVTGHWELWPHIGVIPRLKFDYCDDCGKLRSASARVSELPALENQQKPNAKLTSGATTAPDTE